MKQKPFPVVEAQMLIRKPIQQVFDAFIDPAITTSFWFTKSSGRLEENKSITWEWEMYNVASKILVKKIEAPTQIIIEWDDPATTVEFNFESVKDDHTYVRILNYGLQQKGDALIETIKDLTGGFTTVVDGLKAWMEHGIRLNLVRDKFLVK